MSWSSSPLPQAFHHFSLGSALIGDSSFPDVRSDDANGNKLLDNLLVATPGRPHLKIIEVVPNDALFRQGQAV